MELHNANVQRWLKLPRIKQIFRTRKIPEPQIPQMVHKGNGNVDDKTSEHAQMQKMLQQRSQPIMGTMAIPQNVQKMMNGYMARFKSTSQLLSSTLSAIHPSAVGQKGEGKTLLWSLFLSTIPEA